MPVFSVVGTEQVNTSAVRDVAIEVGSKVELRKEVAKAQDLPGQKGEQRGVPSHSGQKRGLPEQVSQRNQLHTQDEELLRREQERQRLLEKNRLLISEANRLEHQTKTESNQTGCLPSPAAKTAYELQGVGNESHLSHRAHELYEAMKGGFTGLGTEERRVFGALEGLDHGSLVKLKEIYQEHYQRDLAFDLQAELRDDSRFLQRLEPLLQADRIGSELAALRLETSLPIPSAQELERILENRSPGQLQQLSTLYQEKYGNSLLADLSSLRLEQHQIERLQALQQGDRLSAEVLSLQQALRMSDGREDIFYQILADKDQAQLLALRARYLERYGQEPDAYIKNQFKGEQQQFLLALLEGNTARAEAIGLHHASAREEQFKRLLERLFENRSEIERKAICCEFKVMSGQELTQLISRKFAEQGARPLLDLVRSGALNEIDYLERALKRARPDLLEVLQVLEAKPKTEIEQLEKSFKQRFGKGLESTLINRFKDSERFEARLAMLGEPQSLHDYLWKINAKCSYERSGLNRISSKVIDRMAPHGKVLERNREILNRYFRTIDRINANPTLAEEEQYFKLLDYVEDDIATFRNARRSYASNVSTSFGLLLAMVVFLFLRSFEQSIFSTSLFVLATAFVSKLATKSWLEGKYVDGDKIIKELKTKKYGRKSPFRSQRRLSRRLQHNWYRQSRLLRTRGGFFR